MVACDGARQAWDLANSIGDLGLWELLTTNRVL